MPTERYHCEACGWDGDTPDTWEEDGPLGVWVMRVCPRCGTEVFATVILDPRREPPLAT